MTMTIDFSTILPEILLLCGATGLAARSLFDHVRAVLRPLKTGDLPPPRQAESGRRHPVPGG